MAEFFLFAGLMFIDMIIFAVMAMFYKKPDVSEPTSEEMDVPLEENGGTINPAFGNHDEKL